jgi:prepilin-type N-terminal cleavage/methylation domain-containing protein
MGGRARGGFSLLEVMTAIAVFGLMAAIAIPRWEALLAHIRTRGAANRVAADLAYTRQAAARWGQSARLQIEPSRDCPAPRGGAGGHRYRIMVKDSVLATVDLRIDAGRVCLVSNQSGRVVFRSSGLLAGFNNRTLSIRQGTYAADLVVVSAVGRIRRRF